MIEVNNAKINSASTADLMAIKAHMKEHIELLDVWSEDEDSTAEVRESHSKTILDLRECISVIDQEIVYRASEIFPNFQNK